MIHIQPLTGHHNRTSFDCGNTLLNTWLATTARQHDKKQYAKTFVAVHDNNPARILGYYAIIATEIKTTDLDAHQKKNLPQRVPAILIGKLATDIEFQGQGLGKILLMNAMGRIKRLSEEVGIYLICVDAIDEKAASFYTKYGFIPPASNPLKLLLPLSCIT